MHQNLIFFLCLLLLLLLNIGYAGHNDGRFDSMWNFLPHNWALGAGEDLCWVWSLICIRMAGWFRKASSLYNVFQTFFYRFISKYLIPYAETLLKGVQANFSPADYTMYFINYFNWLGLLLHISWPYKVIYNSNHNFFFSNPLSWPSSLQFYHCIQSKWGKLPEPPTQFFVIAHLLSDCLNVFRFNWAFVFVSLNITYSFKMFPMFPIGQTLDIVQAYSSWKILEMIRHPGQQLPDG